MILMWIVQQVGDSRKEILVALGLQAFGRKEL